MSDIEEISNTIFHRRTDLKAIDCQLLMRSYPFSYPTMSELAVDLVQPTDDLTDEDSAKDDEILRLRSIEPGNTVQKLDEQLRGTLKFNREYTNLYNNKKDNISKLTAKVNSFKSQKYMQKIEKKKDALNKAIQAEKKENDRLTNKIRVMKKDCKERPVAECTICLCKYDRDEPELVSRFLNCGHSFCTKCLQTFNEQGGGTRILCPTDRSVTQTCDVNTLPKNWAMMPYSSLSFLD